MSQLPFFPYPSPSLSPFLPVFGRGSHNVAGSLDPPTSASHMLILTSGSCYALLTMPDVLHCVHPLGVSDIGFLVSVMGLLPEGRIWEFFPIPEGSPFRLQRPWSMQAFMLKDVSPTTCDVSSNTWYPTAVFDPSKALLLKWSCDCSG
jgi:hypothetical protein